MPDVSKLKLKAKISKNVAKVYKHGWMWKIENLLLNAKKLVKLKKQLNAKSSKIISESKNEKKKKKT